MLGPIKWRLLTIVAGILLAHAIDSPRRTQKALPRNIHETDLRFKVERTIPWNYRVVRNLYQPNQIYGDSLRFISQGTSRVGKPNNVIRSFRYPNDYSKMSRRSDDVLTSSSSSSESTSNQSINGDVENYREPKPSYQYIPLYNLNSPQVTNSQLPQQSNIESVTIPGIVDVTQPPTTTTISTLSHVAFPTEIPDDLSGRRLGIPFQTQSHNYQNIFIPQTYNEDYVSFDASGALQRPYNEELPPDYDNRYGRGVSGETQSPPRQSSPTHDDHQDPLTSESHIRPTRIEFNQNPTQQPLALLSSTSSLSPPQSLQQHQLQQQQQLQQHQQQHQLQQQQQHHQQQLPNLSSLQPKTYRDDVTKFSDVNGPVISIQRPYHNEFSEKQLIRPAFETGFFGGGGGGVGIGNSAFGGSDGINSDYRSPRHYVFPPKAYIEYSDYPGPPRLNANPYYKSNRSPRVVFPQDISTTGFPSGPDSTYSNDNVVFR